MLSLFLSLSSFLILTSHGQTLPGCPEFKPLYKSCKADVGKTKPSTVAWDISAGGEILDVTLAVKLPFLKPFQVKRVFLADNVEREMISTDPDFGFEVPEYSKSAKVIDVKRTSYCTIAAAINRTTFMDPLSGDDMEREFQASIDLDGQLRIQASLNGVVENEFHCRPAKVKVNFSPVVL